MGDNNYNHVDKKTRLEAELDDMLQQQQQQQYIQYQDHTEQDLQLQAWTGQQNQFLQSMSPSQRPYLPQQHQDPTETNPYLRALYQRFQLQQQQQTLQSMLPYQRLQLQEQEQLRRQLQQQVAQQIPPSVCPFGGGASARQKFMMFLHHIKQRPADNCITFWRGFVAEYYSPRAKQRLCFSQYQSAGHMLGTLVPRNVWQCSLCGTKSGKGVEATFDVLARLFETKYASGVVDELLSLEGPREYRLSNGLMVLEYRKTVQHTVYEQCRVVHEGPLRIIFSPDLKILSWEFCTRRHEEFLLRRLIAPKVNELLEVAQKCQSMISESGSEGVSQQDLQTNRNMISGAGRKMAKVMELESLNQHGYPKKYARALQTYEVVKSMKDLMDFTNEHKIGPIEGLKRLSEQAETMRLQRQKMQEMEQLGNSGAMNRWSAQAQMDGLTTGNNINNSYNHHHHSSDQAALQTYEVVKSMKDLMDFTNEHKIGPIEGLKRLSEQAETMRLQRQRMQEMEQLGNSGAMNMWSDQAQAQMDGLAGNNHNSYNHHHQSSAQATASLTNNHNQTMLMGRLNAMNTGRLEEGFPSQRPTPNPNQSPYWSDQRQNLATGGFLSSPQMQQQQQQHGTPNTLQQAHLPPEDATEIPDDFSDDNFGDN